MVHSEASQLMEVPSRLQKTTLELLWVLWALRMDQALVSGRTMWVPPDFSCVDDTRPSASEVMLLCEASSQLTKDLTLTDGNWPHAIIRFPLQHLADPKPFLEQEGPAQKRPGGFRRPVGGKVSLD